jgi:hypothetical protein
MGFGKSAKRTYMKLKKKAYGERGVKGRYYRVGAVKGLQNLANDIQMIKNRLNVEKKYKDRDVSTFALAQVNQNGEGATIWDITPDITQGIDSDERIGNSIKFTGLTIPLQFSQQVACFGDRRVRVSLLRVTSADNNVNSTEAFEKYWDVNPLTGVRDFNAPRAYRKDEHDGIRCIRSAVVYIPGPKTDNSTTGTVDDTEVNPKDYRFNLKLQDILRYSSSSSTKPDGLRYYLVLQCDAGNRSATDSSLDVPVTSHSTGLVARIAQRSWWVDN